MRLIIFIKLPEHIEPIPLDLFGNLSCQSVLDDVILLSKLPGKGNYGLSFNGTILDHNLTLADNGVQNGSVLELVKLDESIKDLGLEGNSGVQETDRPLESKKPPSNTPLKEDAENFQPVPGRKIDFD